MAQFFTDFSEYTVGAIPGDWTERWATASHTWGVQSNAAASNGVVLRALGSVDGRRALSWNTPGTPTDAEIVCRWQTNVLGNNGDNYYQLRLRGSGASGTETCYWTNLGHPQNNPIVTGELFNGTNSFHLLEDPSVSVSINTWYWLRLRVTGTSIQGRRWADGTTEPTTWTTTTDATITTAGWVGVGNFSGDNANRDFDIVGVGTDGDPAPISPVNTSISGFGIPL